MFTVKKGLPGSTSVVQVSTHSEDSVTILFESMKLSKNNFSTFFRLVLLCAVVGALCWELFERVLSHAGIFINLTTQPIGIDLAVLFIKIALNPGSLGGIIAGIYLFRNL